MLDLLVKCLKDQAEKTIVRDRKTDHAIIAAQTVELQNFGLSITLFREEGTKLGHWYAPKPPQRAYYLKVASTVRRDAGKRDSFIQVAQDLAKRVFQPYEGSVWIDREDKNPFRKKLDLEYYLFCDENWQPVKEFFTTNFNTMLTQQHLRGLLKEETYPVITGDEPIAFGDDKL